MTVHEYFQDFNFMQFDRSTRLGYVMWKHMTEKFNFTYVKFFIFIIVIVT